jgi:hypothetical protein
MHTLLSLAGRLWASPWTLVGVAIGLITLLTGGGAQRRRGVLEFYGGASKWLLDRIQNPDNAIALTLGHVVLGATPAALDVVREHELVHVRQYERWGPFFVPAYLLSSLWAWTRGGDAYRDNAFEREAYDKAP